MSNTREQWILEILLSSPGGSLCIPSPCMIDRRDGGSLLVMPPRVVWDRSVLSREELVNWSFLVAAAGRAMLDRLPQLDGGVINYWEAGNWALNAAAAPAGPKSGARHKQVHMVLLGRSRESKDKDWKWGEAPMYPWYRDAEKWMDGKDCLTEKECNEVVIRTTELLVEKYRTKTGSIQACVGSQSRS